jgi:hypothetical protein
VRIVAALVILAACKGAPPQVLAELKQRSAYVKGLAEREGFVEAWALNSRDDLSYESGLSNVQFIDPRVSEAHWYDFTPPPGPGPGMPVRWMNHSVHLRVRGDKAMTLSVGGMVNVNAIFTRPRLELSLDGALLASQVVDPEGRFAVSVKIPAADVADWADVYLTWTALQDPEREAGEPKVARLEYVHWEPTH